jgi:hypothetical protein
VGAGRAHSPKALALALPAEPHRSTCSGFMAWSRARHWASACGPPYLRMVCSYTLPLATLGKSPSGEYTIHCQERGGGAGVGCSRMGWGGEA